MKVVIDTNVPIAANGRGTHAAFECQLVCVAFLQGLAAESSKDKVLLDKDGLIIKEYTPFMNYHGQPGVGDSFYKFLHDHMYDGSNVVQVPITKTEDQSKGFVELPPNSMDPSDRKFLAVAVKARGKIVNALDTDWHEQSSLMEKLGVRVMQLCPGHGCKE